MLITALVLAVVGLAALVTAVVTSNELIAWVCIAASVIGVILLIVDALRSRGNDNADDRADDDQADDDQTDDDRDDTVYDEDYPEESSAAESRYDSHGDSLDDSRQQGDADDVRHEPVQDDGAKR